MKTTMKRRGRARGAVLTLLAALVLAGMTAGSTATTASAYSCTVVNGMNACTYYENANAPATIFQLGVWHTLLWSEAINYTAPGNRTVYADMTGGACGCIVTSSEGPNWALAGAFDPGVWAQPRSMMRYVAGGLRSVEYYH